MSNPNSLREQIRLLPVTVGVYANKPGRFLSEESIDAILDALIAALPEGKQQQFVLEHSGKDLSTEESMQRFYRYGGYDFALNTVSRLLESAKSQPQKEGE